MKITFLSILLFALLPLTSCKKKETPTKSTNPNSFTLKKDGVPYSPNYIFVSQVDEDALSIETHIVNQYPWDNSYGIFIKRSISPGTYIGEDGESEYFSIIHNQDSTAMFGWESSSLTVLSNDTVQKVMHCIFEATLYNDEIDLYPEITDGEMTIHY